MNQNPNILNGKIIAMVMILSILIISCIRMSEYNENISAGINGSFEVVKNGIPVNWHVYSPKHVPNSDFTISFDSNDYIEGTQSLRFDVKKCSSQGGWHSPGISNQYLTKSGEKYNISFWIKNIGTEFSFKISSVSANSGVAGPILKTNDTIKEWRLYEYEYIIPKENNQLRVELNILKPGIFWIDNINIENIETRKSPDILK